MLMMQKRNSYSIKEMPFKYNGSNQKLFKLVLSLIVTPVLMKMSINTSKLREL
jgi:hypothetical protein